MAPQTHGESARSRAVLVRKYRRAIREILALQGLLAFDRADRAVQEHAAEARARVEQMQFTLTRFESWSRRHQRLTAAVSADPMRPQGTVLKALQRKRGRMLIAMSAHAEAFYYFAHRAAACLREIQGFGSFGKRARPFGTRDVRNHLIEHPEVATAHRNYTVHRPEGFVLKPFRRDGASSLHKDAGLYPNAAEFVDALFLGLQHARQALSPAARAVAVAAKKRTVAR